MFAIKRSQYEILRHEPASRGKLFSLSCVSCLDVKFGTFLKYSNPEIKELWLPKRILFWEFLIFPIVQFLRRTIC